MLSNGSDGYTWNARNRLVSTLSGASFQYDPFGRRTSKTIGGVGTQFLYDVANPVQELSGSTPIANLLTGLGVDEVSTRTDAVGARNFLTDGLGTTLGLTDPSGNLLTQYTYEPFGNTTVSGTSSNPFQFTGRENDGDGLYYYRERYYNPTLQRFISEDPIRFRGGTNFFAYVANSPLNFIDPYGLLKVCRRPVKALGGLPGKLGACHTFLVLSDGTTLGGYRIGPFLDPRPNFPDDRPIPADSTCDDVPASKCDEGRVKESFGDIPRWRLYGVDGTSNTVPAETLRNAGIPYTFPSCAWGAGWSPTLFPAPP